MEPVTQMGTQPQESVDEDVVLLTVPADGGYLGVLRTATAGLAARLHFALDEIEDLRIAVDEACAMLLAVATPEAEVECRFAVTDDALSVAVTVPAAAGARLPAESSFAWKVLTALTTSASASTDGGHASIRLLTRRTAGA
ncbi:MAG TPA: ATP-binding protein [Micromonosporaceae bacterium]